MYIPYDIYLAYHVVGSLTTQLDGSIQTFEKENLLFTSVYSRQTLYGQSQSQ